MVPGDAYLVDEDCLSEVLEKLDDGLRVLRFVEDLSRLSFPQQCLRSILDVFQGPTDD